MSWNADQSVLRTARVSPWGDAGHEVALMQPRGRKAMARLP